MILTRKWRTALLVVALVPVLAGTQNEPLFEAAEKGDTEAVNALLAAGANVNARTRDGATALRYAKSKQQDYVVALLEQAGAKE